MRTILSRRKFGLGLGTLGAALAGSATQVAADEKGRRGRQLNWTFAPVPLEGGTPGLGGAYHIFGGPGEEPSSISNFNGSAGIAFLDGNVTRTNIKTGEQEYLPFTDTDMRFMTGTFRGTDGKEYPGTFAFV
jgi:prepilin-type processing-associated H-X9-DG protein